MDSAQSGPDSADTVNTAADATEDAGPSDAGDVDAIDVDVIDVDASDVNESN